MRAKTQLHVKPDMQVTVTMEMTVQEMDALLESTKDMRQWPMWRFQECLRQALTAARAAYSSEHVTD